QLAQESPGDADCRQNLAASHTRLGLLWGAARPREAEAAHREALALRKKLVEEFPAEAAYRNDLVWSHANLATLLWGAGRAKEAGAAHREALRHWEKLAADRPGALDYQVALGRGYWSLGAAVQKGGRPEAALSWYGKAVGSLEKVLQKD